MPKKLNNLQKTERTLQSVIKNYLLDENPENKSMKNKIIDLKDLIKLNHYEHDESECLDLSNTKNREEFHRKANACTKFIGLACRRAALK